MANSLINASSPYLKQHANNPVDWYAWSEEALSKASAENKLLIISIGYSACHWCHVMERESFEDEEIATIMNKFFVCIKVDREERPDIDQIYMDAVQLMTGRGGWPLNCITLPNQKPIYGGTYFPKEQWRQVLLQVAKYYEEDTENCIKYAEELTTGVQQMELLKLPDTEEKIIINIDEIFSKWEKQLDNEEGGPDRSPKFPMPDNYQYLLQYLFYSNNKNCEKHIQLTLRKLAFGGIYDQLGGGFARYSTDSLWKVPHFEKMLYDNAQLVSLYCKAYQKFNDPLYKYIVEETLSFVRDEMTSPAGGFHAALDADSEHVEGKFYTWCKQEIEIILKEDSKLFCEYYNINERGYWEHDQYILLRHDADEVIASRNNISETVLRKSINDSKIKFMAIRNQRIRPGLDDKIICSWNALMMKAYADAYMTFANEEYLIAAKKNAEFILTNLTQTNGGLIHTCKDDLEFKSVSVIDGFLEDYAFMIDALITLYQATFDEKYLQHADSLMQYAIENFSDETNVMFYFTSSKSTSLIARKIEVQDNVMPSANAVMGVNLMMLSRYFENELYEQRAKKMLHVMKENIVRSTPWFAHWAQLNLLISQPIFEVIFTGRNSEILRDEWCSDYIPNAIIAGSKVSSEMPLLKGRMKNDESFIYICRDKTCGLPVKSVKEARSQTLLSTN